MFFIINLNHVYILSHLFNNTNNISVNNAKIVANGTFLCYTDIIKMEDTTYSVGK